MESTVATTDASDTDSANAIRVEDTLSILYLIIGTLGLLGNSLVLIVLVYYKPMRLRQSNIYIGNQSVIDWLVSLIVILTTVFQDDGEGTLSGFAGEAYCRLWLTKMPLWGLFVSSSCNLVALTIERYLAVVHAIWHKMHFGKRKIWISIALAWVTGVGYNAAYMIPTARLVNGGSCTVYSVYPSVTVQRFNGVLTICVQFFIPLVVLIYCYTRMALVLRSRVQPKPDSERGASANGSSGKNVMSNNMSRARRNIIKTLAVVSFCFVVCWIWNQIFFLMYNLGYDADFTSTFYHFTVVAVFCNCCINPFIYAAKYEQFQDGLKKLFCRTKTGDIQGSTSDAASGTQNTHATRA